MQALLLGREIAGINTSRPQFGALIAHLGFLALELPSGCRQRLLGLGILPTQSLDRLTSLLNGALEIIDPLLCFEVGGAGRLGGLLGFTEGVDLAKRALNGLDQFDVLLAEFLGGAGCPGSIGSQFDFVLGHGHSLRHLRKSRHG
ncbi:hypothetical protein D9M72_266420 [compost metagenome]